MIWNRKSSSEQQDEINELHLREEKLYAELERKNQLIFQLKEKELDFRDEIRGLKRKIQEYEQTEEEMRRSLEEKKQQIKKLESLVAAYEQKEAEINKKQEENQLKLKELEKEIESLKKKEKQYQQNISSMTRKLSNQIRKMSSPRQNFSQGRYSQLPSQCSGNRGSSARYPSYQMMGKIADAARSQGYTSSSGQMSSMANLKGVMPTPSSPHVVQFNPFKYTQGR